MNIKLLTIVLLAGSLAACSGTEEKPVEQTTPLPEVETVIEDEVAEQEIVDNGNAIGDEDSLAFLEVIDDPSSPLSNTTVYFDFDQDTITGEFTPTLDAHAAFMAEHPSLQVTLEGYCDERGTPEYNLALGEKRARAVQDYFLVRGVAESQLELVSYGEENPAVDGHYEDAWAKNRRVRIAYPGR